jgi:hypothetical protein
VLTLAVAGITPGLRNNRNWRLLWLGQAVSVTGDYVFDVTVMLWVATIIAKGRPWAPVAASGVQWALIINAASFAFSFATIRAMRLNQAPAADQPPRAGFARELAAGIRFFLGSRVLVALGVGMVAAVVAPLLLAEPRSTCWAG